MNGVRMVRWFVAAVVVAGSAPAVLNAQAPSFREVAGHDFGERITLHHQAVRYLERLAEASPRVSIIEQGESWGGRSLLLAVVTLPQNHARLDEIRRNAQRLGDPRTTSASEAASIIADQPAIYWLGGSIHGFELSGTEAALKLLEHLAIRDDPATMEVLRNTVVLIDPLLNPDGRDGFAIRNHERIGRLVNPQRDDWNNDWIGWEGLRARTGHYFFDTNRDWFAHTQRETRNRVGTLQTWRPQVLIDAHEMSQDVEFYFDPPTDPYSPTFPDFARRWFDVFQSAYTAAFDSAGFEYMTGERYNYFYPGYTTAWGSYQGAVGKLYEQGSTRGLAITRPDGTVRFLSDALEQQYLAAWTAARTTAGNRERLLREYYEAHVAAVEDGRTGIRRYLLPPEGDPTLVAELAGLLTRNGIEVGVLAAPVRLTGVRDRTGRDVGARDFPAGTFVVEAAQPRNRLLRALLEPHLPVPEAFLSVARARVDRAENPRFYDITAWSLPLLFDVGGYSATDGRALQARPLAEERVAAGGPLAQKAAFGMAEPVANAAYAYLVDGEQAAAAAVLWHLTDRGYRAAVSLVPTRLGGRDVASGTAIIRIGQNDESVHAVVRELAARYGVELRAVDTGLGDPGHPALGSGDVIPVRAATIGLIGEPPVQGYSFGWAWYTLDRAYEIPHTVLRAGSLAGTPLDRFDVLVLPEAPAGALAAALGGAGVERLARWVRDGGTLVVIGASVDFARAELDLALRSWYYTDAGWNAQAFAVPGAMMRATVDPESWLGIGKRAEMPVLVNSSRVYLAPEGPPSAGRRVVARYAEGDALRIAGHAWPESLERLPGAVFAYEERVGRGRVIAFAEDVNFRAYWRGSDRLFLNAVLLGPSAP